MPKRLTREELADNINKIDPEYTLSPNYDYSLYKNNNSKIKIVHKCGAVIECRYKSFQEGKVICNCEPTKNKKGTNRIREKYLKNKTTGRGSYLIKENYLENIFNEKDYILQGNPVYDGNNKMTVKVYHIPCQTYFETTPNRFQQGKRCPECANMIRVGALPGSRFL